MCAVLSPFSNIILAYFFAMFSLFSIFCSSERDLFLTCTSTPFRVCPSGMPCVGRAVVCHIFRPSILRAMTIRFHVDVLFKEVTVRLRFIGALRVALA